ncbi:hypothetical protein MAUB1S_03680 [Mycolicibacterium aubagnense]
MPTLLAGFILNGNSQQIAVAYAAAAAVASIAYSAVFLLLGTVTRHAVVASLVYALVWESLFGSLVPGARTLSVQQCGLALGRAHRRGRRRLLGRGASAGPRPARRRDGGGDVVRGPEAALPDARRGGVSRIP